MPRYLDPKNDLTFKCIFGEHKHLCMSLLNNLLPFTASQQIVSLEYQQNEMVPEIPELKDSIVDVHCTDSLGRQFIVEMQMYWTDSFTSRVMLNASKAYVKQLDKAESYKLLQPVYALNLVNEVFDRDSDYYHHYRMSNVAAPHKQIDGFELIFVELPKFHPTGRAEKKLHDLWLKFLTGIGEHTEKIPPELLEEEVTKEAVRYLEANSYTSNQLAAYDKYWDVIRTERSRHLDAMQLGQRMGKEEGREEGIAVGREEGIAVGREEGIAVGREEGIAVGREEGIAVGREEGIAVGREEGIAVGKEEGIAVGKEEGIAETIQQVALNARREGFTVAQIQTLTGLSKENIEALLAQQDTQTNNS